MLKERMITGLMMAIIVIVGIILLPQKGFQFASTFMILFAAWEWGLLMDLHHYKRWLYSALTGLVLYLALQATSTLILLVSTFAFWIIAFLLVITYPNTAHLWAHRISIRGLMGLFVLIPPWIALNTIRSTPHGISVLFFLLYIIWAADIGAYFAGQWCGKCPLMPQVSPKKTFEGLWGGLLFAWIVSLVGFLTLNLSLRQWLLMYGITTTTVFFSVIGDLFQSMLKRNSGLKDIGHYLPGHGGLLDRIDSLTAAAPIFLLGLISFHLWPL